MTDSQAVCWAGCRAAKFSWAGGDARGGAVSCGTCQPLAESLHSSEVSWACGDGDRGMGGIACLHTLSTPTPAPRWVRPSRLRAGDAALGTGPPGWQLEDGWAKLQRENDPELWGNGDLLVHSHSLGTGVVRGNRGPGYGGSCSGHTKGASPESRMPCPVRCAHPT